MKMRGAHSKQESELKAGEARKSRMAVSILNLFATDIVITLSQATTVLVVLFGAILVINGQMSTGALAALTILGGRSIGPVTRLIAFNIGLESLGIAQKRLESIDSVAVSKQFSSIGVSQEFGNGEVLLEQCIIAVGSKEYRTTQYFATGSKNAFMHPTASIATSVMDIIAGKAIVQSGVLRMGGEEVESYDRDTFYRAVGYVSDSAILYPGSLLQNLSNFREDLEDEAVLLCSILGINDEIERLPYGYKTVVATTEYPPLQRGVVQIIALIRALVQSPKILLLHKADAGLDLEHQKKLVQYLLSLQNLTVIALGATELLHNSLDEQNLELEVKEVHHA